MRIDPGDCRQRSAHAEKKTKTLGIRQVKPEGFDENLFPHGRNPGLVSQSSSNDGIRTLDGLLETCHHSGDEISLDRSPPNGRRYVSAGNLAGKESCPGGPQLLCLVRPRGREWCSTAGKRAGADAEIRDRTPAHPR